MSEQQQKPKSFMQELDLWIDLNVVGVIVSNAAVFEEDPQRWPEAVAEVKRAIRAKVLESYHNGQRTPARPEKGGRYGR